MRSIFILLLVTLGLAACAGPATERAEAPTAPSQPQPGTVTAHMGGQMGWSGTLSSKAH